MTTHIVSWRFAPEHSEEKKKELAQEIKAKLEALPAVIDGIVEMSVKTDLLPSSSMDLMLFSRFTSPEALAAYQAHPAHREVSRFVRSVICERICLDYNE
ncbi:MAG TPA: Dabb family protein [Clostridiales bacterium]|jgi:hypothetical protein|nr:Dabb family protein [Clostridiales bacterium]